MIIWGGGAGGQALNSGGRYSPASDSWTPTNTTTAPEGRTLYSVVWTGGEMIVWGGLRGASGITNTGGRYNPTTDSWAATSLTTAPSVRLSHSAVWTGSEMIIWGGARDSDNY